VRTFLRRLSVVLFSLTVLAIVMWRLPAVHQHLFDRLVSEVAKLGFDLEASKPRFRLLPLGGELSSVRLRKDSRLLGAADRVEFSFSIVGLRSQPLAIDRLRIEGGRLDPAQFSGLQSGSDDSTFDGWPIEIRRLELVGYQLADVDLSGYELHLGPIDGRGGLGASHALELTSPSTAVITESRRLELGALALTLRSTDAGLEIIALDTELLNASGSLRFTPLELESTVHFGLDRPIVEWFQPGLSEQIGLDGRIELDGELLLGEEHLKLALSGKSSSLVVIERQIEVLDVDIVQQHVDFAAAGAWGRIDGQVDPESGLAATLVLRSEID
jgi:hypothetical protein